MKNLAYLVLFAACAGRAPAPLASQAPVPSVAPAPYELLTIDHMTGAKTQTVWTGAHSMEVGIAMRAKNDVKVVIVGTEGQRTVFVPPLEITGLPTDAKGYDYFMLPATEDDGGVVRIAASASSPTTIYTVIWKLSWNAARDAFDIANPEITNRPVGQCEACDA
jgi:hypothetical protein